MDETIAGSFSWCWKSPTIMYKYVVVTVEQNFKLQWLRCSIITKSKKVLNARTKMSVSQADLAVARPLVSLLGQLLNAKSIKV